MSEIGEATVRVERPPMFFAEDGKMPEVAKMPIAMAEQVLHVYGLKQARERIADAVARHETRGHAEAAAKGWAFRGAEKSSPYSRAKTLEDRRKLNPRYAGDAESIKTAIAREAVFRAHYAAARERWLAGDRHVIWPAGTDAMKRRHRVPCEMPD